MPYGITQCYLPPGRGDIPALTTAEAGSRFSDAGGCKAELTYLAGYTPRWYTHPKTVTHPSTIRARRGLTSFKRRTPLTSTPRRQRSRASPPTLALSLSDHTVAVRLRFNFELQDLGLALGLFRLDSAKIITVTGQPGSWSGVRGRELWLGIVAGVRL